MKTKIGEHASYIYIKEWDDSFKPLTTKSVGKHVNLDFNKDGELVGIEILEEIEPEYYEDYSRKKLLEKITPAFFEEEDDS